MEQTTLSLEASLVIVEISYNNIQQIVHMRPSGFVLKLTPS